MGKILIRLDDETHAALKAEAAASHRSMQQTVVHLISEYLAPTEIMQPGTGNGPGSSTWSDTGTQEPRRVRVQPAPASSIAGARAARREQQTAQALRRTEVTPHFKTDKGGKR